MSGLEDGDAFDVSVELVFVRVCVACPVCADDDLQANRGLCTRRQGLVGTSRDLYVGRVPESTFREF